MDFDFVFKMILTVSFFTVSVGLAIKWVVSAYLDYIQVITGIRIVTWEQQKEQMIQERKERDDDPTSY
tara:strand:- start:657 stop:860 length:204 start_codon:yes stop_codon:yes gene_type:complete